MQEVNGLRVSSGSSVNPKGLTSFDHTTYHNNLQVAVEGCCHGELDKIYETLKYIEGTDGRKIDLLICCGDFQAVRNLDDLECMACPPKYRHIQTFYKYYSGEKRAPYPTLFIGGNHEAANYLWELYHGGWAAPNIFFLGYAGVINFGGLRIGGLSGIFKKHHYNLGHYEHPPYDGDSLRSAYHIRNLEVHRLLKIRQHMDIFLSHDWPVGIAHHGDKQALIRHKPYLADEIENFTLGSLPARELLDTLQPDYWFSAHLHTKFAAVVQHPSPRPHNASGITKFLALSKCLPGQRFLQVLEFPNATGQKAFAYDPEWLAIVKQTHADLNLSRRRLNITSQQVQSVTDEEICKAEQLMLKKCGASGLVPQNFVETAPPHFVNTKHRGSMPQVELWNPQTEEFLGMLELTYNLQHNEMSNNAFGSHQYYNTEEIELADSEEGLETLPAVAAILGIENPEDIDLPSD